jgi:hypothetical protein
MCLCNCSGSALGPNNVDIVVVGEQVRSILIGLSIHSCNHDGREITGNTVTGC